MPGRPMPLNPSPTVAFGELLCQRAQGCMKAVNHTGFCSGHRGFKRRADGEEGEGPPKKRRSEPKRKGGKGRGNAAGVLHVLAGLQDSKILLCITAALMTQQLPKSTVVGEN